MHEQKSLDLENANTFLEYLSQVEVARCDPTQQSHFQWEVVWNVSLVWSRVLCHVKVAECTVACRSGGEQEVHDLWMSTNLNHQLTSPDYTKWTWRSLPVPTMGYQLLICQEYNESLSPYTTWLHQQGVK